MTATVWSNILKHKDKATTKQRDCSIDSTSEGCKRRFKDPMKEALDPLGKRNLPMKQYILSSVLVGVLIRSYYTSCKYSLNLPFISPESSTTIKFKYIFPVRLVGKSPCLLNFYFAQLASRNTDSLSLGTEKKKLFVEMYHYLVLYRMFCRTASNCVYSLWSFCKIFLYYSHWTHISFKPWQQHGFTDENIGCSALRYLNSYCTLPWHLYRHSCNPGDES